MDDARTVEDLTLDELRDEVWFWRTEAAADLGFRILEFSHRDLTTKFKSRGALRERIASLASLLGQALSRNYHDHCFACAQPIRPGDAVISDVNEGEMHAECPVDGQHSTAKPGDKIYMDPESIVIDEDHPEGGDPALKPDHIVAHAASRLYSDEQIAAKLEAARALLTKENAHV